MGRRSPTETIVAIFGAFIDARTWRQRALAERVGLSVRQLRARLRELVAQGVPLERTEESPDVYWSLPPGWLPGGVSVDEELFGALIGLLRRLPPSRGRDGVLATLLARAGWRRGEEDRPGATVHARTRGEENDRLWELGRRAVEERTVMRLDYRSASSSRRWRVVSPQKIWKGRSTHLVAYCHEAGELRRFHFGRVESAELDTATAYVEVPPEQLEAFLAESLDGFHGREPAADVSFEVPREHALWVRDDLPDGLEGTLTPAGRLHVEGHVRSIEKAAAYVLSLGGIVAEMEAALAREVRAVAQRVLQATPDDAAARSGADSGENEEGTP